MRASGLDWMNAEIVEMLAAMNGGAILISAWNPGSIHTLSVQPASVQAKLTWKVRETPYNLIRRRNPER